MRRLTVTALAVVLAAACGLALAGANAGDDGRYRVDAIFDNAAFLIPGQEVRVAGATVGEVVDVALTPDRRARVQMAVDPQVAPFRADASCTILPQSIIGEKYVQCAPGTPRAPQLRPAAGRAPTVPLADTSSPVDIDLVVATFRRPLPERLAILLNELGAGLVARGGDLNEVIRRANPALAETRRVLRVLADDEARLSSLVRASDRVIAQLARRPQRVREVVREGATVVATAAEREQRLEQAVAGLPPLLRETRPALRDLRRLLEAGTPVLGDVRRAAPQARRLAADLEPLADAARPALTRLGTASRTGARALRDLRPIAGLLRRTAAELGPTSTLLDELFQSLRARGVVEGLQSFVHYAALATSRFDRVSHLLPAHLLLTECGAYATEPVEGCSARFAAARPQEAGGAGEERRPRRRQERPEPARAPGAAPQPPPRGGTAPQAITPVPPPRRPGVDPLPELLDDLPSVLQDLPGGVQRELRRLPGRAQPTRDPAERLLELLLG